MSSLKRTVEECPEDSDYDRASISLAQDEFYGEFVFGLVPYMET